MAVRGEGSNGQDVWGANFHPFEKKDRRLEYIALINIKPSVGNRDMEIGDPAVRDKIKKIVEKLLLSEDETL